MTPGGPLVRRANQRLAAQPVKTATSAASAINVITVASAVLKLRLL